MIVLVSANVGGIDPAFPLPADRPPDFTSVYYTDAPLRSIDGWDRVVRVPPDPDPRFASKEYKCRIHRQAEVASADFLIWADASFRFKSLGFVSKLVRLAGPDAKRMALVPHPDRRTPAEEYAYIIDRLKEGNPYLSSRYNIPDLADERSHFGARHDLSKLGLYAGGLWGIANAPRAHGFFDSWWDTVLRFSILDQPAISPLLAEARIEPTLLDVPLYECEWWTRVHHA